MICGCQHNLFNCEENVRRFLGVDHPDGSMDLAARDELLEKMRPLIEQIHRNKLRGWRRQDQDDAIQTTFTKLCNPAKMRTWWESPRRAKFCCWVAVIASHDAIDVLSHPRPPPDPPDSEGPDDPIDPMEQAEALRKAIINVLSKSELKLQLVFCMKYSYLDPCVADIAHAARVAERTVFNKLREIKEHIAHAVEHLASIDVARATLIGTRRYPLKGFEQLERARRDQINGAVVAMLATHPIKELLAFYTTYSPLAASLDEIATQVREHKDTVYGWLANIEEEIKRMSQLEPC
jgi:DNA-directed RNA polymerase specialized sigma24 family protein